MCFSATASFITAAMTGAVGVAALVRVNTVREIPLAGTCLFFALQQSVEGLLWLDLPLAPGGSIATSLTILFLFFAEVFWPVYAPMAVLLIEPRGRRRSLMLLCLALGIGVGLYFCSSIATRFHEAVLRKGHIVYSTEHEVPVAIVLSYLAATSLSVVLSSRRLVAALGVIILVGSAVAYAFYWEAFISVWCFFAAAASVVILWHFDTSRRQHHRTAMPWRPGDIAGGPGRG